MFNELGVPVYYTDIEAKKIMNTSIQVKHKLIHEFGEDAYHNDQLNREYLAKIVFNSKERLSIINSIVHPEVESHFKAWVKTQHAPYVIQESALIFENKKQNDFDIIITITAPLQDRIQRVKDRDGVTEEQILNRIKNQIDDEFKVENSDYVIHNIDLIDTKSRVKTVFDQLLLQSRD